MQTVGQNQRFPDGHQARLGRVCRRGWTCSCFRAIRMIWMEHEMDWKSCLYEAVMRYRYSCQKSLPTFPLSSSSDANSDRSSRGRRSHHTRSRITARYDFTLNCPIYDIHLIASPSTTQKIPDIPRSTLLPIEFPQQSRAPKCVPARHSRQHRSISTIHP